MFYYIFKNLRFLKLKLQVGPVKDNTDKILIRNILMEQNLYIKKPKIILEAKLNKISIILKIKMLLKL